MTFKSILKKVGSTLCRAALDMVQLEGKFNITKIGLFVLTFVLYSIFFNWKFAILLMLAIGWHESGHVWAMRKVGVLTKGFYFVPFFGGVAVGGNNYKSYADRIIVFIMGPLWGMLMASVTLTLYWITDSPILGAAAWWQGMLNLFNLLPVNPLDGGRIFKAIFGSVNKRFGDIFSILSLAVFAVLAIKFKSSIFIVVLLFSIMDFIAHMKIDVGDDIPKLSFKEVCLTLAIYAIVSLILGGIVVATLVPGKHFIELFLK